MVYPTPQKHLADYNVSNTYVHTVCCMHIKVTESQRYTWLEEYVTCPLCFPVELRATTKVTEKRKD